MLLGSPLVGVIRPDSRFYPKHPDAVARGAVGRAPLVTQDFGPTQVGVEPTTDWRGGEANIFGRTIPAAVYPNFHRGLDISKGACAGDVLAAAKGEITRSGTTSTGAQIIVVDHGTIAGHRYRTLYGHLSTRLLRVGALVEAGVVVGTLGGSGSLSTGCHLHFAVKKDGRFVDPWRRLRQNASVDPDNPTAATTTPTSPTQAPAAAIPITPASDAEYLAGQVAIVGNTNAGAKVRAAPRMAAAEIRTVAAGDVETWHPTCWVKGELVFESNRWLAGWRDGRWEFTHKVNVKSVSSP